MFLDHPLVLRCLQEVEGFVERVMRLVVQAVGSEERQLVRVLAHGGHADRRRVVEIHVRQLVCQQLHLEETETVNNV